MERAAVLDTLKQVFGHEAFRPGQEGLVEAILSGHDAFGVMPTGAGKSVCYQLPALLLPGITLVVSPLISLMKDQVAALKESGVAAAYLNSSLMPAQQREVLRRASLGAYKLMYVAPERLLTDGFLRFAEDQDISLLSVDEAHCVSQWGQDFRPSYLDIPPFVRSLSRRPTLAAFTATATQAVGQDVVQLLELREPYRVVTGFDRPNLFFDVRREKGKLDWLRDYLDGRRDKSGIVYCATRKAVEQVCAALTGAGFAATRYHAGLADAERRANQEDFAYDRATVMVATNAFGMGIDKSNVSFVIHYNMPKNIESYYQEAGRAGRDGADADCILLYSPGDERTARFLIENSGDRDQVPEPLRQTLLERDRKRLRQMVDYCKSGTCYRAALLRYFGEVAPARCPNCGNCKPEAEDGELVEEEITRAAQMILSCARRVERQNRFGLGPVMLARILLGSRDKRILEQGYQLLPTYGLMKGTNRMHLRGMIEALQRSGYLTRSSPDYEALVTTAKADGVLFRGEPVVWRHRVEQKKARPAAQKSAAAPVDAAEDPALFQALRALRTELAHQAGVPAYVIFHDSMLHGIAARRPRTLEELRTVPGIGEKKLETYGQAVLEVVRAEQTKRESRPQQPLTWKPNPTAYPGNLFRDIFDGSTPLPADAAERLSQALEEQFSDGALQRDILLAYYREGKSLEELGQAQGVSPERVGQYLEKSVKKLRSQPVTRYLRGMTGVMRQRKEAAQPMLRLRPDQLERVSCAPEGISITSFARKLTEQKDETQPGSLSGRQLSNWLLAQGLLTEALSDTDDLIRRPSPAGEAEGIRVTECSGDDGTSFSMVTLTEPAQRWVLEKLGERDEA